MARSVTIEQHLRALADPKRAKITQRFFKPKPKEKFLGIRVPVIRGVIRQYSDIDLQEIAALLNSKFHEIRHFAVLHLVYQFEKAFQSQDLTHQQTLVDFYVAHSKLVNNWDLVDCSAHKILGCFYYHIDTLGRTAPCEHDFVSLATSKNLWQRRIAMVACWYFIQRKALALPVFIAQTLLADQEDLIQKAVGWMLRELGKKDPVRLEQFLQEHSPRIPRLTLRYAIEKFPESKRQAYLKRVMCH